MGALHFWLPGCFLYILIYFHRYSVQRKALGTTALQGGHASSFGQKVLGLANIFSCLA